MSLTQSGILHYNGPGNNGAGAISIPGLLVGDFVLAVFDEGNGEQLLIGGGSPFSEAIVSIADELQQVSGADWSSSTLDIIFFRD